MKIWTTHVYHELTFSQKWEFAELIWRTAPIILDLYFFSKQQFWWCHLKIWTGPIIRSWYFRKNESFTELIWLTVPIIPGWYFFFRNDSFDDVTEKFEVALLSRAEFFLKNILYEVTWIFALLGFPRSKISTSKIFDMLLLSPEETFVKIKQLRWSHLKIWTAAVIMSWNFLKTNAA